MIYLVAYKLTPGRDYTSFYNQLKASPTTDWWHYIDNIWLVKSDETAEQLQARTNPHINMGVDSVLIVEVNLNNYRAWLPKEAHDWMKAKR